MGILHVKQTPEGFAGYLRSHLSRSGYDVTEDHYEGWFLGNFFSIGYISRNAFGSKYHPIRNRMLGYISKEEGMQGDLVPFPGFTDPIALVTLFVFCFIFLLLVRNLNGVIQGPTPLLLEYSVIFTAGAALVTWISTKWSREGDVGYHRLKHLLYPELAEAEKEKGI